MSVERMLTEKQVCSSFHHLLRNIVHITTVELTWSTSDIWSWTFIGPMLVWWWLANFWPILARWTKLWWPNIGPILAYQLYLMSDLCWSNVGVTMVSQHCANIGLLTKLCLPNIGLATLGQCFCWHWPSLTLMLVAMWEPTTHDPQPTTCTISSFSSFVSPNF